MSGPDGNNRSRTVARSKAEFANLQRAGGGSGIKSLKRKSWIVSDWYIFIEYELHLEVAGKPMVRNSAVIYPVTAESKIGGILGYGFDTPL
jgi:hypothetical protein